MEKRPFFNLDLRTPIVYQKDSAQGHEDTEAGEIEERLLCFELNPTQSRSIEPVKEQFLGNLVFFGTKSLNPPSELGVSLPTGHYLFVQSRGNAPMEKDEWLDMAIELQKDGLWERNKPGNLLYVRFLHEDGMIVTQIFRPVEKIDVV